MTSGSPAAPLGEDAQISTDAIRVDRGSGRMAPPVQAHRSTARSNGTAARRSLARWSRAGQI